MVIAIDPSIRYLGWTAMQPGKVITYGEVENPTEGSLFARTDQMLLRLTSALFNADIEIWATSHICVFEMAQPWNSYKTRMSATRGDLQNLYFFTGALWHWASNGTMFSMTVPVEVSTWKGQLPKEVVRKRMCEKYEIDLPRNGYHISDAIGIGDWYICDHAKTVNGS